MGRANNRSIEVRPGSTEGLSPSKGQQTEQKSITNGAAWGEGLVLP